VADVAVGDGSFSGYVWVSDGDGGLNNRVLLLNTTSDESLFNDEALWVVGTPASDSSGPFSSPHSIAFHRPSASLIVANRDKQQLDILDASTGTILGAWTGCFGGTSRVTSSLVSPWGVRVAPVPIDGSHPRLLAFVAVADSPQDGGNQRIVVLDVESPTAFLRPGEESTEGNCVVLSEIPVNSTLCRTPHEIEVSPVSGDIFVACCTVDPGPSNVQRFRLVGS
jgi:hypothetical protein